MIRAGDPEEAQLFDRETMQFYAREASVYAASGPGGENPRLAPFLARLPPSGRILELGCGGGRDSAAMLAGGFEVDPTDGVPEIASEAGRRLDRPVRVMRFDELDAVEAYDGIWAQAALLHVPRPGLPLILRKIWTALKPGGCHYASFKSGGTEGRDRLGRYNNLPTGAELIDLYRSSAEWTILATEEAVGGGYDGLPTPWVAITVRK
ncbi:MAG: class I SAM-dependent methyltransferase [Sphingomonadales bacterium]